MFSPKLRGARSRLYRRRFLQVNTLWKALAEIYTMHSFAPFFNLKKIQPKIVNIFSRMNNEFQIFHFFMSNFAFFCEFFTNFCPDFATNSKKEWRVSLFQSKLRKQIRKLPKILKSDSVKTFHYYSFFIIIHLCPRCWAHRARPRPRAPVRWPRWTEVRAWCLCEN